MAQKETVAPVDPASVDVRDSKRAAIPGEKRKRDVVHNTTVAPDPVPASAHIGIVPFVPPLTYRPTLLDRIRGWFS